MNFASLRNALQLGIYQVINPFVRLLIKLGFTPNAVTLTGLGLNIGVAIIFILGAEEGHRGDLRYVGWAGALILFAGLFDMLDGQVARLGNMKSDYGALFDSVLDRYSELVTFLGICYYLIAHHYLLGSLFTFIALIGSMMVSYTRARAEGLGVECKGGLMQRPERVVLLGVSALACGVSPAFLGDGYRLFVPGIPFHVFETMSIFTLPIAVMAVLSNITAVSRLLQAKRGFAARDAQPAAPPAMPPATPTPPATSTSSGKKLAAMALLLALGLIVQQPRPARAQVPAPPFPVPTGIANQLFYLQRDPNANTVIYQLNVDATGHLNEEAPVRAFWIRYTENGVYQDLSYIQRKFAYGLTAKKLATDKYELKFAAYSKLRFFLMKSGPDQAFHVFTTIANRQMVLTRVFLRIEGGTFWVPNVKYIEFKGWNAASHEPVVERVSV